jgi:hypothetical protein
MVDVRRYHHHHRHQHNLLPLQKMFFVDVFSLEMYLMMLYYYYLNDVVEIYVEHFLVRVVLLNQV